MEIIPFVSVGELGFGDSRLSIRQRLGNGLQSFRKSAGENETDAYDKLGLHLYFDDHDHLEFVEAFEPASPSIQGISLLGKNLDDVERELRAIGHSTEQDEVGLQCESAGIGLTARNGLVEGVAVFRKGYYDS